MPRKPFRARGDEARSEPLATLSEVTCLDSALATAEIALQPMISEGLEAPIVVCRAVLGRKLLGFAKLPLPAVRRSPLAG